MWLPILMCAFVSQVNEIRMSCRSSLVPAWELRRIPRRMPRPLQRPPRRRRGEVARPRRRSGPRERPGIQDCESSHKYTISDLWPPFNSDLFRDKLNNLVLFDKGTYDKLYKEVPTYKLITPSIVSERLKVIYFQIWKSAWWPVMTRVSDWWLRIN